MKTLSDIAAAWPRMTNLGLVTWPASPPPPRPRRAQGITPRTDLTPEERRARKAAANRKYFLAHQTEIRRYHTAWTRRARARRRKSSMA